MAENVGHLWRAYGGLKGFLCSPYLWSSAVATVVIHYFAVENWKWYTTSLAVLPNLLGFSLGGYAVLLAFGDGRFLDALRGPEPDEQYSPYLQASASLAWFVLAQILSLIVSVFFEFTVSSPRPGSGWETLQNFGFFLGCWLFIYAVFLGLAATFSIFFLSRMYDLLPKE
ncbi:hypothetical protein [Humidesulfovibrio sp.]